jgi:hypothetical protein
MWTIPCRSSANEKYLRPKSFTFVSSCRTCVRLALSSMKVSTSTRDVLSDVGTLWSTVTSVQSGLRTPRPAIRSPSKAWGDVTSWTRCRST